jgi:hypothetical protein
MPSSKGKPTDPKLREEVKESKSTWLFLPDDPADQIEVKNETNKDGSGKGQWSAWKVCHSLNSHSPPQHHQLTLPILSLNI